MRASVPKQSHRPRWSKLRSLFSNSYPRCGYVIRELLLLMTVVGLIGGAVLIANKIFFDANGSHEDRWNYPVYCLAVDSAEQTAVAAGAFGYMCVWDLARGELRQSLRTWSGKSISALALSSDGKRLLIGDSEFGLILWHDFPQEESIVEHQLAEVMVRAALFLPDGSRMVTADSDGRLTVWSEKLQRLFEIGTHPDVCCLALCRDGTLVSGGGETIRFWNTDSAEELRQIQFEPSCGIACLAVSPADDRLAVGRYCGDLQIHALPSGHLLHRLSGHRRGVQEVNFCPAGDLLVAAYNCPQQPVRVWDVERGVEVSQLAGHTGVVRRVRFLNGTRRILSAGYDGTIRLWDVASRAELRRLECRAARSHPPGEHE